MIREKDGVMMTRSKCSGTTSNGLQGVPRVAFQLKQSRRQRKLIMATMWQKSSDNTKNKAIKRCKMLFFYPDTAEIREKNQMNTIIQVKVKKCIQEMLSNLNSQE